MSCHCSADCATRRCRVQPPLSLSLPPSLFLKRNKEKDRTREIGLSDPNQQTSNAMGSFHCANNNYVVRQGHANRQNNPKSPTLSFPIPVRLFLRQTISIETDLQQKQTTEMKEKKTNS